MPNDYNIQPSEIYLMQMVILSLIVKKTRVKALVKDMQAALEAFGLYVEVCGLDYRKATHNPDNKLYLTVIFHIACVSQA